MDFSHRALRAAGLRFLADPSLQTHPRLPFAGLEQALAALDLPPAPLLPFDLPAPPTASPAFKNLEADTLLTLRKHLYAGARPDLTLSWAEALTRFCEVRLASLKPRAVEKWGTLSAARLNLLELGVFLLDAALAQGERRFLNTALKLTDQAWLFPPPALPVLGSRLAAVWQWRMKLVIEYLLMQEETGRHG